MSMSNNLKDFLFNRKTKSNEKSTHNSLQYPFLSTKINSDDLPTFYKLYEEDLTNGSNLGIVEQPLEFGSPILIDLDFRLEKCIENVFNLDCIVDFTKKIIEITQKYVVLPLKAKIYVLTKPIREGKNGEYKDGIHVIIPDIFVCHEIQQIIRLDFLKMYNNFFERFGFQNTIEDIYDESVLGKTGWLMYGSKKKDDINPWLVKYVLTYDFFSYHMKIKTLDEASSQVISFVQMFSIRNKSNYATLTDEGEIITNEFLEMLDRKRQNKRNNITEECESGSMISSCSHTHSHLFSDSFVDYEEKQLMFDFVQDCVKYLNESRADNYKEWIELGFCLRSINYMHIETWIEFSKQSSKFDLGECEMRWKSFKSDGATLDLGTLLLWLKNDTSEEIYEDFSTRLSRYKMILSALSSPHNIAKVIKLMYKDTYLYADKKWFCYDRNTHRWRKMTNYLPIREKISDELLDEYSSYVSKLKTRINYWNGKSDDLCKLEKKRIKELKKEFSKKNKEIGEKETKEIEESVKSLFYKDDVKRKRYDFLVKEGKERLHVFNNIVDKLCSTSFKDNIMKEVTEIFNDPFLEKYQKFDTNLNLLGFTNGVFDLDNLEFRDGDPDDFLTFTTGYDFIEFDNDEIQEYIMNFMRSITKNEENMNYLLSVLAYMLHGCKYLENFWFLTGAGRNGKGTLMTLVKNTLGDYYYEPSIEIVTTTRQNASSANPEMVKAIGKRVLVCSEPDDTNYDQRFRANKLKQLRGNDPIQARPLYGDPIEYPPQFGMIFQMNQIPEMSKTDDAIAKTLKIIEFPYQFVQNPKRPNERKGDYTIKSKFSDKEYCQQFMRILLRYYKDNVHGKQFFEEPKEVIEMTQTYVEENNPLGQWVNDNVDITNNKDDKIKTSDLYYNYKTEVESPVSAIRFGKDLSSILGLKSKVIKGSRYYEGIKLREDDSEENENENDELTFRRNEE